MSHLNVIGCGCSIGIIPWQIYFCRQIQSGFHTRSIRDRNCRERNNNSMNGSAVMQSNLSGCAFIVARECYRDSGFLQFCFSTSLFPSLFFFFIFSFSSDQFDTDRSIHILQYISTHKQTLLFFLASRNNREHDFKLRTDFYVLFVKHCKIVQNFNVCITWNSSSRRCTLLHLSSFLNVTVLFPFFLLFLLF